MAVNVLNTKDGREKTALSRRYAKDWFAAHASGPVIAVGTALPPQQPRRLNKPDLLSSRDVPKRKPGTLAGQIALLPAVAHIELNAVDLHWDIIPWCYHVDMTMGFYDDWVQAADDKSKH